MRLRAHHLLCILGFRGLGYDEKFIKKMESIIQRIKKHPALGIKIIKECDDICVACPFDVEGFCRNEVVGGEKAVRGKDREVMERLELKEREKYNLKEILNLIKKKIKPDDLLVICKDCPWLKMGYCEEGLKKIGNFFREGK
jgi:hypothetical protein